MLKTAISLFSGCGGDTLGMTNAGIDVKAFVEIDRHATASHLANFPDSTMIGADVGGDITKVPDVVFEAYENKIDIIFSGSPCQGFSNAGKKDPNDPRNKLLFRSLDIVKIVKPRWVFIENVSGLVKRMTDTGDSLVMDVIVGLFADAGYCMETKVFSMTDFGVPQKRKRVFMIARLVTLEIEWSWPRLTPPPNLRVRDIITADMDCVEVFDAATVVDGEKISYVVVRGDAGDALNIGAHPYITIKNQIITQDDGSWTPSYKQTEQNRTRPGFVSHKKYMVREGNALLSFSKRASPLHSEIMDLDQPSKTIICTYARQPRLLVALKHNDTTYIRAMNPLELKQIQGFPPDFQLVGTRSQQIKQIGNAVPPVAVQRMIEHLRTM